MARYCPACGHPTQAHDRNCEGCDAGLLSEGEAQEAQDRWTPLPATIKTEMEAEHARRCQEWSGNRDFYERTSVWKHLVAGALIFGRKRGLFLGTRVGARVFIAVLIVRTGIVLCLRLSTEAFLMNVAQSHYADRIAGLVCPAAGGLLGYLIEQEFEARG